MTNGNTGNGALWKCSVFYISLCNENVKACHKLNTGILSIYIMAQQTKCLVSKG